MRGTRVPLNDLLIQKLKPPSAGQTELFDARAPGLSLRCGKSGTKVFYLTFRLRPDRKRRRGKLGVYPVMRLTQAREARIQMLAQIALGIDPFTSAKAPGEQTQAFDIWTERFISEYVERKSKKPSDATRIMRKEFAAVWGARDVRGITKADVQSILNEIVARGRTGRAANRALARIRKFFNWLIDHDVINRSPCHRLPAPVPEVSRDRVLSDAELAAIWNAADSCGYPYAPLTKLLILLGQRRSEVGGMRWAHLDLAKGLWTMPNRTTKNKQTHLLPLPQLAIQLIQGCPRIGSSPFLFPSGHDENRSMTSFASMKERLDKLCGVTGWIFHDFRRSMATHMPALSIDETLIERIQNHSLAAGSRVSQVHKVYNRYKYVPEMRAALEKWSAHVQFKILVRP